MSTLFYCYAGTVKIQPNSMHALFAKMLLVNGHAIYAHGQHFWISSAYFDQGGENVPELLQSRLLSPTPSYQIRRVRLRVTSTENFGFFKGISVLNRIPLTLVEHNACIIPNSTQRNASIGPRIKLLTVPSF